MGWCSGDVTQRAGKKEDVFQAVLTKDGKMVVVVVVVRETGAEAEW